ncbi:hypothetical protein [Ensifer sp. MJa1]|jgi:hypothetical protein
MDNDNLWYCLVGTGDTNTGLARIMGAVVAFIAVFGTLFWLIGL